MTIYPNGGALILADIVREALDDAEVHLYTEIASPLSQSTVIGDLTEADFSGYAMITLSAWLASYIDPTGGASFQSGTQQWNAANPTTVQNVVLGWYLLTSGGDLLLVGEFESPIPMSAPGDAIPLDLVLNYGKPT